MSTILKYVIAILLVSFLGAFILWLFGYMGSSSILDKRLIVKSYAVACKDPQSGKVSIGYMSDFMDDGNGTVQSLQDMSKNFQKNCKDLDSALVVKKDN
jgi:hypothetical protein